MVDAAGTTAFTYNNAGLLQSEDGPWAYDTVSYSYANKLRTGLSLQEPSASDWTESYAYDVTKRLTSLTSPAGAFGYVYTSGCGCPGGSLVKKITLPNGAYITNNFDGMARMMDTTLKNSGNTSLDYRAYLYNVGSQRTKETRFDGSYVDFTYDAIGQLKSALGKESGGSTRLHEQYGYAYDAAGNLNYRTNNALIQTFNVNNKNELTTETRSGTLTVAGTTSSNATSVTVNGSAASRYSDYTFARTNNILADGNNTFTAVAQDALSRSDSVTNTVYLPATVNFGYDSNGNLLTDGKRGFDYDDENQLIRVTVTNSWKTEFTYDGQQRRRIRKEFSWQSGAWAQTAEVRYLYDGNIVIQERDANNVPLISYSRGRDLSGSLQGAGGIGGLLARTDHLSLAPNHSFYFSDGNGNVTALLNATQVLVAKYLYDSYGNIISSSGPLADVNLYRFSSKEIHAVSGLVYFGRRFYDPNFQRWPNKDPIGLKGSLNLFGYSKNNPVTKFDRDGLLTLRMNEKSLQFNEESMVVYVDGKPYFILGEFSWRTVPALSRGTTPWFRRQKDDAHGKGQPAHYECGYTRPNYVFDLSMWYVSGGDYLSPNWVLSPDLAPAAYRHEHLRERVTTNFLISTVGVYEKEVGDIRGSALTKNDCQLQIDKELSIVNQDYVVMNRLAYDAYQNDVIAISKKDTPTYTQPSTPNIPWTIQPGLRIDETTLNFYNTIPDLLVW
jgi:RHS repeat-associated protein